MSEVQRPRKGLGAIPTDPPASSAEMEYNDATNGDDAFLDLDQLEELHDEAERMKALGNKHMAAQVRL